MRKRGNRGVRPASSLAKLKRIFPYQTPKVLAILALVSILMIGLVPSRDLLKPTTTSNHSPLTNQNHLDQIIISPTVGPVIGAQEITSKEASPDTVGIKAPILMYHYIEFNPNPKGDPGRNNLLVVPPNFELQLTYLHDHGWTTISLDELLAGLKDPATLPAKPIVLTFDDGYSDFYYNAYPLLQKYKMKATIYVLSRGGHPGACGNNLYSPGFYMTDDQLRELAGSPLITVAAHTQDHCYLKGRPLAIQQQEIAGSKTELESIIGKPVRHFAYPYGAFDDTSIKVAQQAGYASAASTIVSSINNESSIFTLRRVRMGNLSLSWFVDQINK